MKGFDAGEWASADPGLLGGVLIALASGWIVRRALGRRPDVFACLALGVAGALLGLAAAGAAGLAVSGWAGLLGLAAGGAVFIQALAILIGRRTR